MDNSESIEQQNEEAAKDVAGEEVSEKAEGPMNCTQLSLTSAASIQNKLAIPMISFGEPSTTFGAASSGLLFPNAIQTSTLGGGEKGNEINGNTENADKEDDGPPNMEYKQFDDVKTIVREKFHSVSFHYNKQ